MTSLHAHACLLASRNLWALPTTNGMLLDAAASVSSIQFEHRQRQGLGWQDFHVATFSARGAPAESYEDDEPPLPQGLRPERACLFTRKDDDLQCSFTYSNAPGNAYLLLSKQFYTDVSGSMDERIAGRAHRAGRRGARAASGQAEVPQWRATACDSSDKLARSACCSRLPVFLLFRLVVSHLL